ncbi:ATP-binding protein [Algirhabdus cladophorae]|uniref:ATP-binding protein n=1 Tax=Algirhabdus cladophorae TaxID=3377108 RepID=UPI003B846DF3
MDFEWLKNYMPRSLYGRAALILLLPVVVLQLAVSIVFVQRHFSGVTEQMTRNMVFELGYVAGEIEKAPDRQAAASIATQVGAPLGLGVRRTDTPVIDARLWYDFTGITVISALHASPLQVVGVDLKGRNRSAIVSLNSRHGMWEVSFARRRISASNPHQLLVLTVFISILMSVIAIIFLRNQLRPIKRLARAATAFGTGQRVPYRPSGATEVREAGHSFIDMRNRIERHIEQRTLMLSGVSHDLRTPLTRLRLELSMLDESVAADMLRDVEDMQRMLDEFLNFARADAIDEEEVIALGEFVTEIVEDTQRHGAKVQLMEPVETTQITVRAGAVRRAVENLIGNALRYGTSAQVSVWVMEKSVRIRVEDDGPGISPQDRIEAVKPFTRLEASRNQNAGSGVGLGLAITNDIARSHGGTLRLGQSERLGGLMADLELGR